MAAQNLSGDRGCQRRYRRRETAAESTRAPGTWARDRAEQTMERGGRSRGEKGERKVTNCAQDREKQSRIVPTGPRVRLCKWGEWLLLGWDHTGRSLAPLSLLLCWGHSLTTSPQSSNQGHRPELSLETKVRGRTSAGSTAPRLLSPTGLAELIILIIILTNYFFPFPLYLIKCLPSPTSFFPIFPDCVHISSFSLLLPT